jgi:hypothetical protein
VDVSNAGIPATFFHDGQETHTDTNTADNDVETVAADGQLSEVVTTPILLIWVVSDFSSRHHAADC